VPIAEKGRELGLADHIVTGSPESGTRRGRGKREGKPSMTHCVRGFRLAMLLAVAMGGLSFPVAAQDPSEQLRPPPGELLQLQVHGKGDQVYVCKGDGAQFSWTLKAPDAQLFDGKGKPFGKHFAGPSWEANDGSRVVGKAVANVPSPEADSIPWLLVTVVSHEGSGVLSRVTSIQRVNTKGGKAPASGCDVSHAGQETRAAYSADYRFYAPK
jgi:hypothetical protein